MKKITNFYILLAGFICFSIMFLSNPSYAYKAGGVLTIHSEKEPKLLNPLFANSDSEKSIYNLLYSSLVGIDDTFTNYPDLASYVPTTSNRGVFKENGKMVVLYKLREEAFWHDGEPITTSDIKFTWECYTNPNIKKISENDDEIEGYKKIEKIEEIDPKTFKIYFKETYSNYTRLFKYVLPKHGFIPRSVYSINEKHPYNFRPIGSGPFVFMDWKDGKLILDANLKYYKVRPHLDQIVYIYKKLDNDIVKQFERGQIQYLESNSMDDIKNLITNKKNLKVLQVPQLNMIELAFNTESSKLKNKNIRNALARSIDRDKIVKNFSTLQSFWSDAHPSSFLFNTSIRESYIYDLNYSQYLLDLEQWNVDYKDGIRRSKDKTPLDLKLITTSYDINKATANYLKEIWSYLGINLSIEIVESENWNNIINNSDAYDIVLYSRKMAIDGSDRINYLSPKEIPPNGKNYSRFKSPQIEAILTNISRINNFSDQRTISFVLNDEIPVLPLFSYVRNVAISKNLNNFRPNLVYGNTWNSMEWWLN